MNPHPNYRRRRVEGGRRVCVSAREIYIVVRWAHFPGFNILIFAFSRVVNKARTRFFDLRLSAPNSSLFCFPLDDDDDVERNFSKANAPKPSRVAVSQS